MRNKKPNEALQLIASSNDITGIHLSDGETLHIDYINRQPEEDDIVICGKDNTIFLEDLDDCVIVGNSIKINNRYMIHIK
jgi:hypothetical protein